MKFQMKKFPYEILDDNTKFYFIKISWKLKGKRNTLKG
jgi:hypothetical protein